MAEPIILPYQGVSPKIENTAYVAPGAAIIGDVEIGENSNIWFNVTIRGDVNHIRIGKNTNVQDNTVCHVTRDKHALIIGNDVTIGHGAIIHGCTIGNQCLIGMGATIMDGAVVEDGGMVAAGAVITPGKIVQKGELWTGVPAKFWRRLTEAEAAFIPWSAMHYVRLAQSYMDDR